jgi:hypothetical protein
VKPRAQPSWLEPCLLWRVIVKGDEAMSSITSEACTCRKLVCVASRLTLPLCGGSTDITDIMGEASYSDGTCYVYSDEDICEGA